MVLFFFSSLDVFLISTFCYFFLFSFVTFTNAAKWVWNLILIFFYLILKSLILHTSIFITDFITPMRPCSIVWYKPLRNCIEVHLFLRTHRSSQHLYLIVTSFLHLTHGISKLYSCHFKNSYKVLYIFCAQGLHHIFMFGYTEVLL